MDKSKILFILLFSLITFINTYNNTLLRNVTKDSISTLEGYDGCYALYDRGANDTATCTQFVLDSPYICCRVHYEIDGYSNDFCMPIANNADAIGDVVSSFSNADDLDVDCRSNLINLDKKAIIFLLMILF